MVGDMGGEEVPFIGTGIKYLIGGEVAKCPLCVCVCVHVCRLKADTIGLALYQTYPLTELGGSEG